MLDGNDKGTFYALRLLRDLVAERRKPVIIWAGAGVSIWCGFPSWQETASRVLASYRRFEPKLDRAEGQRLFQEAKFPELFEILRQVNPQRYNRELTAQFTSREPTPVYKRFLGIVNALAPLHVVTTNVDETLERNLPGTITVQSSDLERCLDLLPAGKSFLAKLHGSVSSIESTVFATADYRRIQVSQTYLKTLQALFAQATVVFIGYSLRDRYVFDLFEANCEGRPLFGDGPHFLVQSGDSPPLPDSMKVIHYLPGPYADHRSAIAVLDIIRVTRESGAEWFAPESQSARSETAFSSAYFLTDVTPPGTWTSSQSLVLARNVDGLMPNAIIGQGFDDTEIPQKDSPAVHDLIVGLISFDYVHVPLSYLGRLHDLLGSATFWNLVRAGVFRFIYFEQEPLLMFRSTDAVDGGDTGMYHRSNVDGSSFTIDEQIRLQIQPLPGKEQEVNEFFDVLAANVHAFDHTKFNIPSLTRGALLHPSVRRLLGIGDAVFPNSLPRWTAFPVIRLAHTIMAGCACDNFNIPATKLGFGSEILVGAAFAVSAARDWADSVTSYVLTSSFNSDLAAYVQSNPSIWATILTFRDTGTGVSLRQEILEELATNVGSEFVASVNAGLRHIVPTTVMENARDKLTALLFRNNAKDLVVPAVWTNTRNSDKIARLWRARSRRELEAYCRTRGIRPNDLCPCLSGERLRDCCAEALKPQ